MTASTAHNTETHRAKMEELKARHAAEIAKANRELEFWQGLQDIPTLSPRLFYGALYGVQHVSATLPETGKGYKQTDPAALPELFAWIEEHAHAVHKWHKGPRGYVYLGPALPSTADYQGSTSENAAKPPARFRINYSTITRRAELDFYITHQTSGQLVRVTVELPTIPKHCQPVAIRKFSASGHESDKLEGYNKPQARTQDGREAVTAQALRHSVDRQSADLETLYTYAQILEALNITTN